MICFRLFWVVFFLYFFILGLEILGDGAQVMTGCIAGELFSDDQNPLAGVMIGIIITVCMQSSSTTTSITVSLVGAGVIGVEAGIYVRVKYMFSSCEHPCCKACLILYCLLCVSFAMFTDHHGRKHWYHCHQHYRSYGTDGRG
jgi:hypothetical protein